MSRRSRMARLSVAPMLVALGLVAAADPAGAQSNDTDGDGIPNASDSCPNRPETVNGFADSDGCPDSFDELMDLARRTAGSFWADEMPRQGPAYQPPSAFTMYDNALIVCGDTLPPNNAVYMGCSRGLYFHRPFMESLFRRGDFIPVVVVAHEWGHLAQHTLGFLESLDFAIARELQADCFAGAYARSVEEMLEPGDLEEAIAGLFSFGGTNVPWLDPQYHGSGGDRADRTRGPACPL